MKYSPRAMHHTVGSRKTQMGRGPLVLAVLLLLAPASARADATDEYVRKEMERQRIPGLSLVVLKNGRVVKAAGYVVANRTDKTPATQNTVYNIGSVSKTIIASGIMRLVQDGRLGLEDPLGKFLPDAPPAWNAITIRQLLSHTSGLAREAPGFDPSRDQPDIDVLRSAYPLPLASAPGQGYLYSNVGYFALAETMRRVTGRPWVDYVAESVLEPAGMTSTRPSNSKAPIPNRATGYTDNDRLLPAPVWVALRPSGAFMSTVMDLGRWDAVLYTDAILSEATRRQMWTAVTLPDGKPQPYGLGWEIEMRNGRRLIHHGGGVPGFQSELLRYVDDGVSVAVVMNLDDGDVEIIAQRVAELYLPH